MKSHITHGIYTIEIRSPKDRYLVQTDDVVIDFSNVCTQYIRSIQHQNSQRAISIFINDVFSLIHSHLPVEVLNEPQGDSPTQTSRHTVVRQEIHIFSKFLNAIREHLTKNEVTHHVKHDLQKILALFIIDYFSHSIDLIERARKNFRPQNTDDETVLAEKSDYVSDPEWSNESFINIPTNISTQAISTISINKVYVRVYPLTVDATPINYISFFHERKGNNSLTSTFIYNDNIKGTRNFTQKITNPILFCKHRNC